MLLLLWKMPICLEKGQKGSKVGGAFGMFFCILLNIASLDFFDILHEDRIPQDVYDDVVTFMENAYLPRKMAKRSKSGRIFWNVFFVYYSILAH